MNKRYSHTNKIYKQQRLSKGYDPYNSNHYPPNLDFIKPGLHYKLRPDEAIVLIG